MSCLLTEDGFWQNSPSKNSPHSQVPSAKQWPAFWQPHCLGMANSSMRADPQEPSSNWVTLSGHMQRKPAEGNSTQRCEHCALAQPLSARSMSRAYLANFGDKKRNKNFKICIFLTSVLSWVHAHPPAHLPTNSVDFCQICPVHKDSASPLTPSRGGSQTRQWPRVFECHGQLKFELRNFNWQQFTDKSSRSIGQTRINFVVFWISPVDAMIAWSKDLRVKHLALPKFSRPSSTAMLVGE